MHPSRPVRAAYWRPPAPKAVYGVERKPSIFSTFCFKQMARSCCALLKRVEFLESFIYDFIYTGKASRVLASGDGQ
jgi:hypothetical protein